MNKILLALCAIAIFAACNNNKKETGTGGNMFGNETGNNNNNNIWKKKNNDGPVNNDGGGNGRWSDQMRMTMTNTCMQELGQVANAKQLCDCWVGKVEAKFANVSNPQQIPEEAANQLAMECLQQAGGGLDNFKGFDEGGFDNYGDGGDENYNGGDDEGGNYPNTRQQNGRSWPAAQRQQWMMGCTTTAQQTMGATQQQAAAYCDCMTRKVEAKYTFEQAVKLTVQDFSTPEWQNARMECQMNAGN